MVVAIAGNCETHQYFYWLCKMQIPEAGDMRSPVLRHRPLVPYVPLRAESSANVLRWYSAFAQPYKEIFWFRNYLHQTN